MRVDELFYIRYGHGLSLNRLEQVEAPNGVNYVSRGLSNNGVSARVQPPPNAVLGQPGELTVALNGQVGALGTFLQPDAFVTGYHVAILSSKESMTPREKLWWARCIWQNHFKYGFGRQANRTLGSLELPSELPEWVESVNVPVIQELTKPIQPAKQLSGRESGRGTH
nr:type I restriction endonuclease subunit S [Arthrobacter sp.]